MNPEIAQAILASAKRLGADPVDLATVISFESGGTFSPSKWGGKNNNHLGIIQFGSPEREKYGVHEGQSFGDQMVSAENFLRDRGYKPGMGMADLYSTVNAGAPGLYNRSDTANGGTPGTVLDKVTSQMGSHRAKAAAMLGMVDTSQPVARPAVVAPAAAAPAAAGATGTPQPAAAVPSDNGMAALMAQLQAIPKMLQQQQATAAPAPVLPDNMAARLAMIAAAKQGAVS